MTTTVYVSKSDFPVEPDPTNTDENGEAVTYREDLVSAALDPDRSHSDDQSLHDEFDATLDEYYLPAWSFNGIDFMPSTILKNCDPIAYDLAYDEWLDDNYWELDLDDFENEPEPEGSDLTGGLATAHNTWLVPHRIEESETDSNVPKVGWWADHRSGSLDPREVIEVSPNQEQIRIRFFRSDQLDNPDLGTSGWLNADNYTYHTNTHTQEDRTA